MSVFLLPPPRLALRHTAVRAALLLLGSGPLVVAWWGMDADAPIRLRLLGLGVAVVVALAWDDRTHALTASTPVGLPAVRRGRTLVVATVGTATFGLGWLAVPGGVEAPGAAFGLQAMTLAALLLAVVGWVGRDGDPVLAVPFPALLVVVTLLYRLPRDIAVLRADPRSPDWGDERTRWWLLLAVSLLLVLRLERDPAARSSRRTTPVSRSQVG